MATYHVVWEIDVDAYTLREAAERAREIQRDKDSWAGVFAVTDENGDTYSVDLDDSEPPDAFDCVP